MDFLNTYFFRPMGFGWETSTEDTTQQTKKRTIEERDKVDAIPLASAFNTVTNTLVEPEHRIKRQKLIHDADQKQAENKEKNESLCIELLEDTSDEEIVIKPKKILPPKLPQPQNIKQLNQALLTLEEYHSQGLIDLDMGDRSFRCLLLPLLNEYYNQSDAWLSDFFIINFIKEKIASSGKGDILIYDFNPDNPGLNSNMLRVAKQNKDKEVNKIIWPICKGQHFYLIAIDYDVIKNTVYIYALDGFNSKIQQQAYLQKATEFAEMFYPQADCYMKIPQKIFNQGNAMDCAVVACYYANHFIKKTASEFPQWAYSFSTPKSLHNSQALQPYTPYRKKIAETIFTVGNRMLSPITQLQPEEKKIVIELG